MLLEDKPIPDIEAYFDAKGLTLRVQFPARHTIETSTSLTLGRLGACSLLRERRHSRRRDQKRRPKVSH
jgi:hypothetical protein